MSFANSDDPSPYQAPLTDGQLPPTDLPSPLATRVNRFGAAIIDGIIGMVVTLPVILLTGYLQRAIQNNVSLMDTAFTTCYGLVAFLVIHGYLLATRGQTVGKLLAKVKIVDYHSNQLLPFGKLIASRYLPIWITSLIPFLRMLCLVDVLFIFGDQRRCVHDYIAGTKVVAVTD